jgi:hypothetical protein
VVAGGLAALFSWQSWINPFVDGGRELAVPARLADGARLYRDVVFYYGPVGPWVNAIALRLFGRHFGVLEAVGLLLTVVLFVSLYRLTARAGSPLSACVATTLAAALCVGAPNGGAFLFPYSFGALFALSGGFLCLSSFAAGSPVLAATGLSLALAAKPEIGAAAAMILLVSLWRATNRRAATRRTLGVVVWGCGIAAILYGVAFAGLSREHLFPQGPLTLLAPPAEWRRVYAIVSGLEDPARSLESIATALFLAVVILAGAGVVAAAASRGRALRRIVAGVWALVLLLSIVFLATPRGAAIDDRLPPLLAPMPLAAAAAALLLLRAPLDEVRRSRFLLFGFSACVGTRVLLGLAYGAVTTPYSIFAVPGLAATAAVLTLDGLSSRLAHPAVFRRAAAAVFLALALTALLRQRRFHPPWGALPVETAAGTLRLPAEKAAVLGAALRDLEARARPGDELAGFPEAGFFHFVTGLSNPLRQDQVLPGHLDREGETLASRLLEQRRPRFVLLLNQPAPAFGRVAFGRDYAVRLWAAVLRGWAPVAAFGDPRPDVPVGSESFFIRIYEPGPPRPARDVEPSTGRAVEPGA